LAILLREWLDERGERREFRIYATDVRENAVNFARRGLYSTRIVNDLSPERLARWFVQRAEGFQVVRSIRDGIVWGRHNVLVDPPFSNMDLLSCRNLLVYLHRRAQALALSNFHFSLRAHGALLLGTAESTMAAERLFEPLDYANRLYRKSSHLKPSRLHESLSEPLWSHGTERRR
jgi:two-component system CheB/CheR fusion protein